MSDPLDLTGIRGLDPSLPDTCTLEATLVTGFEPTAAEELLEKMGLTANMSRGRIVFDIAVDRVRTSYFHVLPLKLLLFSTATFVFGYLSADHSPHPPARTSPR